MVLPPSSCGRVRSRDQRPCDQGRPARLVGESRHVTQTDRTAAGDAASRRATWSPWRTIFAFGLVSLSADMVYEGMRAMAGPFLGYLGASAFAVGLITGAGEAVALVLRLVTGAWADHGNWHWRLTVIGYAMTAVCVPLLAVTPFIGAAGLAVAA